MKNEPKGETSYVKKLKRQIANRERRDSLDDKPTRKLKIEFRRLEKRIKRSLEVIDACLVPPYEAGAITERASLIRISSILRGEAD